MVEKKKKAEVDTPKITDKHTHARTHAHTHSRTHDRTHTRTHAQARTHARTHAHTHTHASTHAHTYTSVCVHALCMCVRVSVQALGVYRMYFVCVCCACVSLWVRSVPVSQRDPCTYRAPSSMRSNCNPLLLQKEAFYKYLHFIIIKRSYKRGPVWLQKWRTTAQRGGIPPWCDTSWSEYLTKIINKCN